MCFRKYYLLIFFCYGILGFSQNNHDVLVDEMCQEFIKTTSLEDSIRLKNLYEKVLLPYFKDKDSAEIVDIYANIYFRMQKKCPVFKNFLDKIDPPNVSNEEWKKVSSKPISTINEKDLEEFKNQKNFYYLENDGSNTKVVIEKGRWTDFFSDGTTSKLNFNWLDHNKFRITFIESDNLTRKNFNKKGETYDYEVLKNESDYFLIYTKLQNEEMGYIFKLHKVNAPVLY